jgi:hypothetical protein
MDFFQSHQTVPKPLLSYLLPYSRTFNCIVKRLAGSPKGWNWSTCYANKVLLQVAHAFLYTLMDFFQSHKLCPSRCYLTFFHIPERSIALVKRLAGSPKGWNWSQPAYANKVLLKVAHAFLYTLMDFFQSHQTVPNRCYLFFHIPERSIALVNDWLVHKRAEMIPTCPQSVTPR